MGQIVTKFIQLWKAKELAEGRVIPLAKLAQDAGVSPRTLLEWRKGRIRRYDASVLEALCEYFGCGVGDLLVYEPRPRPPA